MKEMHAKRFLFSCVLRARRKPLLLDSSEQEAGSYLPLTAQGVLRFFP